MRLLTALLIAAGLMVVPASAQSAPQNTVTFSNQSGESALVKLVGPTRGTVPVPNGSQVSIRVDGGQYYILVRYGSGGRYTYSKGQGFAVEEYGNSYSMITITLHKVLNGNYESRPASPAEFERQ